MMWAAGSRGRGNAGSASRREFAAGISPAFASPSTVGGETVTAASGPQAVTAPSRAIKIAVSSRLSMMFAAAGPQCLRNAGTVAMSVRNALGIDLSGLRKSGRPLYILLYCLAYLAMYGLVFPFLAYVWFWVLVAMLTFLYNTKEPQELLLISMAVLTAVRVTAYYNEDLSRDISKILPYGLLGIFLVNLGRFDLWASLSLVERVGAEGDIAFYYWVYISGQELVLRISQPCVSAVYNYFKTMVSNQAMWVVNRSRADSGEVADSSEDSPAIVAEALEAAADGWPDEE